MINKFLDVFVGRLIHTRKAIINITIMPKRIFILKLLATKSPRVDNIKTNQYSFLVSNTFSKLFSYFKSVYCHSRNLYG